MTRFLIAAYLFASVTVFAPVSASAVTLYETDFVTTTSLTAYTWVKGSTSLNGFVDIIDLHGYSQSLRMHTKTPTGPSLNYATLSIETAGYKNLKMTFDHYTGYDQSDAYVGSLPATGLVDADGIMISDGSTDKWHLLWTPPTLPSLRTGGRFWTTSIEVDIGALLIAKNLNPIRLKSGFNNSIPMLG